jgi:hypothetical protein
MRFVSGLCLLVVVACASSGGAGSSPSASADQTMRVVGAGGASSLTMSAGDMSAARTLAFTPDQIWRVLPAVFDSLGIPMQTVDPAKHQIGASSFAVRHRLKNVALSRYLDCGSAQMGSAADDYDVRLSVLVDVQPVDEKHSRLTATVDAVAKPANYAQDYARCLTRGALENRVFSLVNARLAR